MRICIKHNVFTSNRATSPHVVGNNNLSILFIFWRSDNVCIVLAGLSARPKLRPSASESDHLEMWRFVMYID